jgi:polysaccharide pyruvyl transferase WcaK-like protein
LAQEARKTTIIDVKTENSGADLMADNRRIISIQIGDSTRQELYYADASVGERSLFQAVIRIRMLISQGCVLAGYGLKGFEVPLLKRFLAVTIPEANALDLRDMDSVKRLQQKTGKASLDLSEVCSEYGIPADHRRLMDEKAEPLKKKPEILAQANEAAKQLVAKGWNSDSSLKYALDTIANGHAILESYEEFVQKGGAVDTLFHKYAVGDVACEHRLLQALQQHSTPTSASPPVEVAPPGKMTA